MATAIPIRIDEARETLAIRYPGAERPGARLVLAHGAGAGQRHPWMVAMARGLAERGIEVLTFDFPYAHEARRVPDRPPLLERCFRAAIETVRRDEAPGAGALFIGGKSMGGRIATHLSGPGHPGLAGTIVFGYPLHPPGKPHQPRSAHLPGIAVPLLIVQGERDAFGTADEVTSAVRAVPAPVTVHIVAGGDHSLAVRGTPDDRVRAEVADVAAAWMRRAAAGGG